MNKTRMYGSAAALVVAALALVARVPTGPDGSGGAASGKAASAPVAIESAAADLKATRLTASSVSAGSTETESAWPGFDEQMPIAEMVDLLGDRARAGEPAAACQLGHALSECKIWINRARSGTRIKIDPSLSAEEIDDMVESVARAQESIEHHLRRCANLDANVLRESTRFIATAALGGHADSLVRFAGSPRFEAADFLRDPTLAHTYRTQLWPAMQRALLAGDREVTTYFLFSFRDPDQGPLVAVLPERFQDPAVAGELTRMFLTGQPGAMIDSAESGASRGVSAAAGAWIDELFGGRLPDGRGRSLDARAIQCRNPAQYFR